MKNIIGLFLILAFSAAALGQQAKAKPASSKSSVNLLACSNLMLTHRISIIVIDASDVADTRDV